jgi:MoxR-like ATPase
MSSAEEVVQVILEHFRMAVQHTGVMSRKEPMHRVTKTCVNDSDTIKQQPLNSVGMKTEMEQANKKGASPMTPEQLRQLQQRLTQGLVERETPVKLALLAALAGEHVLLLGPPGTAKSMLAQRLCKAFLQNGYFERLLTRFSVPEELFGPLSIKGLQEDRYERLTDKYLPTASVAFLDEIFKANSAILNSLLTLLNERKFDNGTQRLTTPLISLVGASNELPEGEELDALYDRFLVRLHVGPVSKDAFSQLITAGPDAEVSVPDELRLDVNELAAVRKVASQIQLKEDVLALLSELRDWCAVEGIPVSDRRWRKVVKLLQVSAFTCGRLEVGIWDCWLLQHCLWAKPEERERIQEWYEERVGAAKALDPKHLTSKVVAFEDALKRDQEDRSQQRDAKGRLLFVEATGKKALTTSSKGNVPKYRNGERLYLAPANASSNNYGTPIRDRTNGGKGFTKKELDVLYVDRDHWSKVQFGNWDGAAAYLKEENNFLLEEDGDLKPAMEPTRHKPEYIRAQVEKLDRSIQDVKDYLGRMDEHIASAKKDIEDHLWVDNSFGEPATVSLLSTKLDVLALKKRLEQVREGFLALPQERAVDGAKTQPQKRK